MKKIISIFLSFTLIFSLTACSELVEIGGELAGEIGGAIIEELLNDTSGNREFERYDDSLIVHFIDCGNADSTFIELPNGQTMIIDAGNNGDGKDIVSYIQYLGYDTIDYIIGTHPHEDHIGGLDDVINAFEVNEIYLPRVPDKYVPSTITYKDVLTAIMNKGKSVTSPDVGDTILQEDALEVKFLTSSNDVASSDMNKYSLVVSITYGNNRFIVTGDADKEEEEKIISDFNKSDLRCDVLKIGHHGSYTASCDEWLKVTSPIYAYIPCGVGNQYEHPHDVTLKRLDDHHITYFRADLDGTVVMISDGNDIQTKTKMTGDIPLGDKGWNISMAA